MHNTGRLLIGLMLLGAGVMFLLDATEVIPAREILSDWWPVGLILLGLVAMTGRPRSVTGGGILIVTGAVLLLATLDFIDVPIWQLVIALILIGSGVNLIIRGFGRRGTPEAGNRIAFSVILGEQRVVSEASSFRTGSITSILGEATLDLRRANLDTRGATVDAFCLLGDVDVIVPRGWRVQVDGMPILGDFKDETDHDTELTPDSPPITVTGVSMLADIEVKHSAR